MRFKNKIKLKKYIYIGQIVHLERAQGFGNGEKELKSKDVWFLIVYSVSL